MCKMPFAGDIADASQTHRAIVWAYRECAQRVRSMRLDGGEALDHPNRIRTRRMVPMSRNGHLGRSSTSLILVGSRL